jgi:hypothetical protein
MAIVQNPITGRTTGKFASAVFSKQFEKNTMRSKPIQVANPKTLKQRTQRMKFSMIVALAQIMLNFIRLGFKTASNAMSEFNSFVKANISTALSGSYPDFTINFPALIVSSGTLTGIIDAAATAIALNKITVSWFDNTGQGDALATDKVLILCINTVTNQSIYSDVDVARSAETYDIEVPAGWVGDDVAVYVSASNEEVTQIADSSYVDTVTVLE